MTSHNHKLRTKPFWRLSDQVVRTWSWSIGRKKAPLVTAVPGFEDRGFHLVLLPGQQSLTAGGKKEPILDSYFYENHRQLEIVLQLSFRRFSFFRQGRYTKIYFYCTSTLADNRKASKDSYKQSSAACDENTCLCMLRARHKEQN